MPERVTAYRGGARCAALVLALVWQVGFPSAKAEGPAAGLANATVVVMRHAEDALIGDGLSATGRARAEAYATYFQTLRLNGKPFRPDCLFAAADSKASARPRLTLAPLASALGQSVDTSFKTKRTEELARTLRSQNRCRSILIVWRHGKIPRLVRALGGDPNILPHKTWPKDVFDWMVVLSYDSNGAVSANERQAIKIALHP